MKRREKTPIFFSLILVAIGEMIASQQQVTAKPAAEMLNQNNSCVHLGRIISIHGRVQLKRREWANYQPTAVGAVLCQGDLLHAATGAKAMVQCADPMQNLWAVTANKPLSVTVGCRPSTEPIHNINGSITPTRDPLNRRIPYIISPNNTFLLTGKPTLRWLAVPGANNYVIRVSGPGVDWKQEVNTTKIIYPEKPSLKPVEEGYLIIVEADNGEAAAKAFFNLLDEKKAARVRAAIAQLNEQNLTGDAKVLAVAEIYIGQGLIADAVDLLEADVNSGSQIAAVHYILGNLYAQGQLFFQAEKSYLKAVELAVANRDVEGQAAAATRLAQVYQIIGEEAKAAYWSKQAQKGYQALISLKPASH